MENKIKNIIVIAVALCCAFSINFMNTFAQSKNENNQNDSGSARAINSNSVLGYEYVQYSSSNYEVFTSPVTGYDYSTIVVDASGRAAGFANDFANAIDDAESVYLTLLNKVSNAQGAGIFAVLAAGPLSPLAFLAAIVSLKLTAEAEKLAIEVNDYLMDAERAFSFLYRYRVTDNGGCVTISGQEICPMTL